MKRWFMEHARAGRDTLGMFVRAPLSTLFNIAVVGVALALPAGLYTGLSNLQAWSRQMPSDPQLSVFLARDASRAEALEIGRRLNALPQVSHAKYVPKDQALAELTRHTGFADVGQGLEENPLPDAFVVNVEHADAAALERMRAQIATWPRVEHVQLDSLWEKRLAAALRAGKLVVMLLATVLAFALVAVTFNTIRLQILTQRARIEVETLIGATDAFIRRPFLYNGALLGIAGGAAAWGLVAGSVALLNGQLTPLSHVYGWPLVLAPLSRNDVLSLVAFSAALGWLGAWVSVTRHLAGRA